MQNQKETLTCNVWLKAKCFICHFTYYVLGWEMSGHITHTWHMLMLCLQSMNIQHGNLFLLFGKWKKYNCIRRTRRYDVTSPCHLWFTKTYVCMTHSFKSVWSMPYHAYFITFPIYNSYITSSSIFLVKIIPYQKSIKFRKPCERQKIILRIEKLIKLFVQELNWIHPFGKFCIVLIKEIFYTNNIKIEIT